MVKTEKPKKARPAPEKIIPHVPEMDATKKRVHPRFVTGKYQNIRLISMYAILIGFLILPWLRWNDRQAILFDVIEPKFYIFGATFMPQDFYFFAFVFIIAAMLLFMVTVYAGRVWCGYACPQTIYVHLYQHVEKWIIGDRNKRMKFDKAPWTAGKIIKFIAIHSIWGVFSAITALTFIALVVGTDYLFFNGATPFFMGWGKMTWIFFLLITFVTQTNGGYMREHMCVHICPYGRFQSVMFDKDTLIVSYDYERGEPRGARKKNAPADTMGDCVDCSMCVQVCPTGIDIRDGLQVECIQCAACIDACNDIMDKVGYPRGLIRYTTERQLVEKQKTKILSPRIFAYIFVLGACIVAATLVATGRAPLEMEIRHDRKQLSTVGRDGLVENSYVLKIVNKTDERQVYKVRLEPVEGLSLRSRFEKLPLQANEPYDLPVSVFGDPAKIQPGHTPITITVYTENGEYSASADDIFIFDKKDKK
ncbi:cytochrome c oxidase accessory protein CcoG [Moraxella caviae]|uniref:Cytochrome c oxidase accessory protein CcoG n=1 Tax=Moraxella caviae TaxID=34060 RepID=A0A1S9ZXQ2_9GAMM|nr:cytochrome c oxidase accessory protein CcoG [Moraxella caviae]OOR87761.1 cytochrome c oxidase accessory protein CcoG [Moraxella caviae]